MFNTVNDAIITSAVLVVPFPLTFEGFAEIGIETKPVNRLSDLLATFSVGLHEAIEFFLGHFREDNGIGDCHRQC